MSEQAENEAGNEAGSVTVGLPGYTYFIQDSGEIKIGSATNFKHRLGTLQVGNSRQLIVLAAVPSHIIGEYEAHQKFAHLRTRGEWFWIAPDLLAFIAELQEHNICKPAILDDVSTIQGHLSRVRRKAAPEVQPLITNLIGQLKSFRQNPGALRPRILDTLDRLSQV